MIETRSVREWIFDILNHFLLAFIAFVTLYPMLYLLLASVSNPTQFMMKKFSMLIAPVGEIQWNAYRYVFKNKMVMIGFSNTFLYVIAGTAISMFITFLGAYVLSRKGYRLKKLFTVLIMFTMYFSGGVVPYFLQVRGLGMLDTIWAMIIPSALSTYNLIVLRTAFDAIPPSLHESGTIDGAGDYIVLFHIYIPLSIPTISVVGLFYAVARWNAWFDALIFLRSRSLFPLQLVLREILITSNAEYLAQQGNSLELTALSELIKYATIIVATVPILLIYPFIQKYFVKGMMIGAVKG